MIPYYERIAVYSVDKEFVRNNKYTFDFKKTGYNHLCLETDNLLADVERLRAIGVQIDQEPKSSADKNWQAWIHDPDGNKLELMMIHPDSPQARTE